jgi:hypothetical protein
MGDAQVKVKLILTKETQAADAEVVAPAPSGGSSPAKIPKVTT